MNDSQESKFVIQNMAQNISSFISLQGSIGAGKSTILEGIKRYLIKKEISTDFLPLKWLPSNGVIKNKDYFLIINEPSQEWSKELYSTAKYNEIFKGAEPENASDLSSSKSSGMNTPASKISLLGLFYEDMERNGLMFQIHAFTTR